MCWYQECKDVEALPRQRFEQIGEMEWENVCCRIEEIEQHYWNRMEWLK